MPPSRLFDNTKLASQPRSSEVVDPETLAQVSALVQLSMADFSDVIHQHSFGKFYNHISKVWKKEIKQKDLENAFSVFITRKVDLRGLSTLRPVFAQNPRLDEKRVLNVAGHYPSAGFQVLSSTKFVYSVDQWKLCGVNVSLKKVEP